MQMSGTLLYISYLAWPPAVPLVAGVSLAGRIKLNPWQLIAKDTRTVQQFSRKRLIHRYDHLCAHTDDVTTVHGRSILIMAVDGTRSFKHIYIGTNEGLSLNILISNENV